MFGNILRSQVEERLSFFETGDIPRKNCDVMAEALVQHKAEVAALMKKEKKEKKKKTEEQTGGIKRSPAPRVNLCLVLVCILLCIKLQGF